MFGLKSAYVLDRGLISGFISVCAELLNMFRGSAVFVYIEESLCQTIPP